MRTNDQRRLDRVVPVLAYCRLDTGLCPAALAAVARLESLSTRTRSRLAAVLRARSELSAATRVRDQLMGPLRSVLGQIVRLAVAAALQEGDPGLQAEFRIGALTKTIPLDAARVALDTATRHRDLLLRYGMPEELLDRLRTELDRYAAALQQQAEASATIGAANADLAAAAREGVGIIRHLDALNRIRLAGDPERLAEWQRVRAIRWASRSAGRAPELGSLATE